MCKESDLPCRRITEGIRSLLKINGPLYRQKGMIWEGHIRAWKHCLTSGNKWSRDYMAGCCLNLNDAYANSEEE